VVNLGAGILGCIFLQNSKDNPDRRRGAHKTMMLTEKPQFKKWVTLSAVLGFTVFILYLVLFTDFTQVGIEIAGMNLPIYLLAFVFVVCSTIFNALNWKAILNTLQVETTFSRIFSLTWVAIFIDSLIPGGWTGDLFKTYLLAKDKEVQDPKQQPRSSSKTS
jgi:uncharacterized membrane protein YbhN (UPF0104 family)